ncbi:MAG: phosphoenolpyruvate--protein phosphotransferase [Candidatus Aureabacteria bacterium]|nr:phosphoenolpyruvate--protein phosphotransferase [Candidatus Auribacterota bacterium]
MKPANKEIVLRGIPVCPGVVIGKVYLFDSKEEFIAKYKIPEDQIPGEIARFEEALITTRHELVGIQNKIASQVGEEHAQIFNAHLLFLEDRSVIEQVIKRLEKEKINVEYIFQQVGKKYVELFSNMEDDYLRERASDIRDFTRRVLYNLMGKKKKDLSDFEEEVIIVAYDLSPSDTAMMHKELVKGFATDVGGKTSHTAIIARSLEIPAVVGLHNVTGKIKPGARIIVDGNRGLVIIHPSKRSLSKYTIEKSKFERLTEKLAELKDLPAETIDGYRVSVSANIEMPADIPSVISHGAEGVGLYRTEFFYFNRTDLPSEEEQYTAYKKVAEEIYPNPVIIRTLDIGGDKFSHQIGIQKEMNPFLGWRAIRICLEEQEVFKQQLRAILRASAVGNVKLMYPMISSVDEVLEANKIVEEVKTSLDKSRIAYDKEIEMGAMIEIPSAAITSDIIARHVDFFSIGTNDLIQYSIAVDRVNEKVAYLYEPANPAVLRLIKSIIDNGHAENIWVGMCGEMAGDLEMTLILVGMGIDELSASSIIVPEIKKVIRSSSFKSLQMLSEKVLKCSTSYEVRKLARALLKKTAPEFVMQQNYRMPYSKDDPISNAQI